LISKMDSCPWEIDGDDESDDDDWFYSSLTKYEHLLMYSLSVSAQCMSVSQDGRYICVGGTRNANDSINNKNGENELLVYSIPAKLNTTCPLKEGLSSSRDFKLRAGAFTDSPIKQASFSGADNEKLWSSSRTEKGVRLWNIPPEDDLISSTAWLSSSSISSPVYCEAGGKCYLAGDSVIEQVDVDTWTIDQSVAIGKNEGVEVEGVYCDEEEGSVWWCDGKGRIGAQDLRSRTKIFSDIELTSYPDIDSQDWTFSFLPNSFLKIAAVGSHGKLCTLDTRSTKKLFLSENLTFNSSMPLTPPSVCGSRIKDEIAVQSADVVNVYSIKHGQLKLLFEHDGHKKKRKVGVLSTAWHTGIHNLLFSADSQQNLHAWSFPVIA